MNDVVLVDFRLRTVFRRRVNPSRGDAVLVEAVRPGGARRVELGAVVTEVGGMVWVPNPDADPDLFDAFRACLSAAGRTPVSWAVPVPTVDAVARPRLAPFRPDVGQACLVRVCWLARDSVMGTRT